ncbi:putative enoyl reductase [Paramyrothecium foliicola]|nr:putative enoyl reductase [Paramyrothecium foliicola]
MGADDHASVQNVPLPTLQTGQFLVRTDAVAINPSDTKMRGSFATNGGVLGTDYAGTVVALGPETTFVQVGDRVCGAQNAMNANMPLCGSFGAFNIPTGKIWLKLPESVTTEGAATFGAGISTAGLALKLLGLPLPDAPVEKSAYVLVYGGSTATATIAMQLLRLANLIPIATCSPNNSGQVKAYGAEVTFDYHEPDCAAQIKAYTKNNLRYALDCITTAESTTICFAAIGRAGGKYVSLDPPAQHATTRSAVKTDWVLGPSIFGDGSTWPAPYGRPPDEETREFGERLWALAQDLVNAGKLRHHPVHVVEGGLSQVPASMKLIKNGQLSGKKCVSNMLGMMWTLIGTRISKSPSKALLCFHGTGSKGSIFNVQMAKICYQLRDVFEFIFLDGPLESAAGPGVLPMFSGHEPYYGWFAGTGTSVEHSIEIITATVKKAVKNWNATKTNPDAAIVGAIGFSEGATALLLMLWQQQHRPVPGLPTFQFAALSCCFFPNEASLWLKARSREQGLSNAYINIPTLHIHGNRDFCLGRSRKLVRNHYQADFATVMVTEAGHHLPVRKEEVAEVARRIRQLFAETGPCATREVSAA